MANVAQTPNQIRADFARRSALLNNRTATCSRSDYERAHKTAAKYEAASGALALMPRVKTLLRQLAVATNIREYPEGIRLNPRI